MTAQGVGQEVRQYGRRATRNPLFRALARAGFVASGIVQLLVGVIAITLAVHHTGSSADQSGALGDLAKAPGGPVLLWVVTIGSFALGVFLVVSGALAGGGDAKTTWGHRLRDWGKAVVYLAIGFTALQFAMGGSSNSSHSSRQGSADLLKLPGGPVILGVLGVGVVVLGAFLIYRGASKGFVKTIRVPPGAAGRATVVLGQVGYAARGVAIGVVGVLFVAAAFTADPNKASGLDGALKAFAALPFGAVMLVVIGLGWIASGVYTVIRAKLAVLA
jgi:hypothetical protein